MRTGTGMRDDMESLGEVRAMGVRADVRLLWATLLAGRRHAREGESAMLAPCIPRLHSLHAWSTGHASLSIALTDHSIRS